jgi:hypothetical protein
VGERCRVSGEFPHATTPPAARSHKNDFELNIQNYKLKMDSFDNPLSSEHQAALDQCMEYVMHNGMIRFMRRISSDRIDDGRVMTVADFMRMYNKIHDTWMFCNKSANEIRRAMYTWHTELMANYISDYLMSPLVAAQSDASFIHELAKAHQRYSLLRKFTNHLCKAMVMLNRPAVPQLNSEKILESNEKNYWIFKTHVLDALWHTISRAIRNILKHELIERHINQSCEIHDIVNMLLEIGHNTQNVSNADERALYKPLETEYILDLVDYCKHTCAEYLSKNSCDYLRMLDEIVTFVRKQCAAHLHIDSADAAVNHVMKHMVYNCVDLLKQRSNTLENHIEGENIDALGVYYRMMSGGPMCLAALAQSFHDCILKKGSALREEAIASKSNCTEALISMYMYYSRILKLAFGDDRTIYQMMRRAFEAFINIDYSMIYGMCNHLHGALVKGDSVKNMDIIGMLYTYIRDKDIFEKYYQSKLGDRLLAANSGNTFAVEKEVISNLKAHCGYQWGHRLDGMHNDIMMSRELLGGWAHSARATPFELNPTVLTQMNWTFARADFELPAALQSELNKFEAFYKNRYSGRRLNLIITQGTASLGIDFGGVSSAQPPHNPPNPGAGRRKELVVTSIMMLILLMFNEKKTITCADVAARTRLPKPVFANHLLSLAHPNLKVLCKKPMKKELLDTDEFCINETFSNKLYRIAVPLCANLYKAEEDAAAKSTRDSIMERAPVVDACIVRIMKARRHMSCVELQSEVVKQLMARFMPDVKLIKARIEHLIDNEYLCRDENNRTALNYMA